MKTPHLSLKLIFSAPLPSTYKVLPLPGRSKTTPLKAPTIFADWMCTLRAYGSALSALFGKRVARKSNAARSCDVPCESPATLPAPGAPGTPRPFAGDWRGDSEGVSGGVAKP